MWTISFSTYKLLMLDSVTIPFSSWENWRLKVKHLPCVPKSVSGWIKNEQIWKEMSPFFVVVAKLFIWTNDSWCISLKLLLIPSTPMSYLQKVHLGKIMESHKQDACPLYYAWEWNEAHILKKYLTIRKHHSEGRHHLIKSTLIVSIWTKNDVYHVKKILCWLYSTSLPGHFWSQKTPLSHKFWVWCWGAKEFTLLCLYLKDGHKERLG